jgi:Fic family protein
VTKWEDSEHVYPSPQDVDLLYDTLFDYYNEIALNLLDAKEELPKEYFFDSIIKLVAWLVFHFLSLHPFVDGNGRTARILAAYVLLTIVPFPIAIINPQDPTNRRHFIKAIVEDRSRDSFSFNVKPIALANMIMSSINAATQFCIAYSC